MQFCVINKNKKSIVMLNKLSSTNFHLRLFKTLLLTANAAGLIIYLFVHLIFFDFPFDAMYELSVLLKMFAVATSFALAVCLLVILADAADFFVIKRKMTALPLSIKTFSVVLVALVIFLASCNVPVVSAGIKKDFNTGMSSSYNGMEPEKVMLVMNNEVLGHTDIPLGESFLIVNDGIKGMQAKNGKVKVGCALSITDKKGKLLLNEKDLFAGHDEFEEKDAQLLKCTVNTGEPMQWEEKYDVSVTFWDKNGSGKIENKVTIRSIDMP